MYRACGAFYESYAADMRLLRTGRHWLALGVLAAAWFGGSAGIAVAAPQAGMYWVVLPFLIAAVFAALFILQSAVGRAFIAVRDNDLAAEVTGIDVTAHKVLAFGVASFYAGTAGALLAYQNQIVQFEQFTLFASIW